MIDKLDAIRARFDELGVALTNPAIVNDNRNLVLPARNTGVWKKL